MACYRCGRRNHFQIDCFATYHVDGSYLGNYRSRPPSPPPFTYRNNDALDCLRCGRTNHNTRDCFAITDCYGHSLSEQDFPVQRRPQQHNNNNNNYHAVARPSRLACYRCGRLSHLARDCYARYHVDGSNLDEDDDSSEEDCDDDDDSSDSEEAGVVDAEFLALVMRLLARYRAGNMTAGLYQGFGQDQVDVEEITSHLPQFHFSSRLEIVEEKCVICQEDYSPGEVLMTLPCVHNFHTECLRQWLTVKLECPLCKEALWGRRKERKEDLIDTSCGDSASSLFFFLIWWTQIDVHLWDRLCGVGCCIDLIWYVIWFIFARIINKRTIVPFGWIFTWAGLNNLTTIKKHVCFHRLRLGKHDGLPARHNGEILYFQKHQQDIHSIALKILQLRGQHY